MKIILVYNQESKIEREKMELLEQKLGNLIIAKHYFQDVKDILPVRTTPAFIVMRDDLEGDELLDGDIELKIEAEVAKIMEEEEFKIHGKKTHRLDNLIKSKIEESKAEALKLPKS